MAQFADKQDLWTAQRRRRNRFVLITALMVPAVLLIALIVRNNMNGEDGISGEKAAAESAPGTAPKSIEVYDGKKFRVMKEPDRMADTPPLEPKYTFRLANCFGVPLDEKKLVLKMAMDLQFNSPKVLREIERRQDDLRVLVNLKVSQRKLAEIEVSSLRPALISAFSEFLHSGDVSDIRFVDFRVERRLTEN